MEPAPAIESRRSATGSPAPGGEPGSAAAPPGRLRPRLFRERSRPAQALLAIAVPGALGALAGVLLGVSGVAYLAISAVAGVGAFLSGFEHHGGWDGADRGLVAGATYGVGLLVAHAIAGTHATVALGSFPPALVVVTALVGTLLTAAGAVGREPGVVDDRGPRDGGARR